MLRTQVHKELAETVHRLKSQGRLPADLSTNIEVSDPRNPEHGDFATNFALMATKEAKMPPRAIAETLQEELCKSELFESVEIAGPGFINFRLKPEIISGYVAKVLELADEFYKLSATPPLKINVEFVSVNPNGPITVGSGRGAAFGDTLSRVFESVGHRVDREYYINDGVNSEQMRLFAESVKAYVTDSPLPEKGYQGEYVKDVANTVKEKYADATQKDTLWFQQVSQELMIERQKTDLAQFGVEYQNWFSEQSLHDKGAVEAVIKELEAKGKVYRADKSADAEEDPEEEVAKEESAFPQDTERRQALWLRSTQYGDDKDRVLERSDGRLTYLSADVAYLKNKFERGYDRLYLILGPDHHGYIGRLKAACEALGYNPDHFQIVIFQIVRFMKDGKPAPMRKRDGNIYELRDLMNEIGTDVTRFFYLMRSHDTHMDFDIDLAAKQSDENPVFYAQYAHARICSVIAKAAEQGFKVEKVTPEDLKLLSSDKELTLIKKILDLPHEAARAAEDFGVHRLTTYAVELARTYHHFYDACRVILPGEPELTKARLALCHAARIGLKGAFDLLGVSAPERMDREGSSDQ